jgi:pyruvate-formate lyase-activating enzyme
MTAFICDYLNEITLLCDGRVTTCCIDPFGINVFGDIHKDSYSVIQQRYKDIRRKITHNVTSMPRCRRCYNRIVETGFPETGTYKIDPGPEDIQTFIEKEEQIIKKFVIELTIQCNLHCNGCMQSRFNFSKYRNSRFMDIDLLKEWLGDDISKIRLYNYGETFLHPKAIEFCSYLKEKNSNTFIVIATNGMLLNNHEKREKLILSGADHILFSIHGSSQEIIRKYMTDRFDFHLMLDILKDLVAIKAEKSADIPVLTWKYLLFEWNDSDEEIDRAIRLKNEIGLDNIMFDLVGFPSPSKRFSRNSGAWKKLKSYG